MRAVCGLILAALLLSGCAGAAGGIAVAQGLQGLKSAQAYLGEQIEYRQELRRADREIVREQVTAYRRYAVEAERAGDLDEADRAWSRAREIIESAMPRLVDLKERVKNFFRDPEAEEGAGVSLF